MAHKTHFEYSTDIAQNIYSYMSTLHTFGCSITQGFALPDVVKPALDDKGKPLFDLASGISLMLFYAFAMQCMSTLAIVKRETNSWKWPLLQLVFMSSFAYLVALAAYQIIK